MRGKLIHTASFSLLLSVFAYAQPRQYSFSAGLIGGLHNADYAGSNQEYITPFTNPFPYNFGIQTEWEFKINKTISFGAGLAGRFTKTEYNFKGQTMFFPIEDYVAQYFFSTYSVGATAAFYINASDRFGFGLHFGNDYILKHKKTSAYNFGSREPVEDFIEDKYYNALLMGLSLNYALFTSRNHDFAIQVLGMYRNKQLCNSCIPLTLAKEEYVPLIFSLGINYAYKYGKRL